MSSDLLAFAADRRTARATLLGTWLAGGTLKVYTAPRPDAADAAVGSATLLAAVTFDTPGGTVTNGVWTADDLPDVTVAASGTAVWARLADSAGAAIADVSVGLTGEAVTLADVDLVAGGLLRVTACAIAEG